MDSLDGGVTQWQGDPDAELAAGQSLGQYRIIRLLGRGGMGQVYEVEHDVLGLRYALTILPSQFARQPGFLDRFKREAQVMARLEHPGIVRVDEFAETDGRYWLRMQLVHGVDLASFGLPKRAVTLGEFVSARGGRLPQEEMADLLLQTLEALAYAHGHGVVHRDMKPGNLLLEDHEGGRVARISDFGLVRLVGEEWLRSRAADSLSSGLTVAGSGAQRSGESTRALLGTYEFMSPEQKEGAEADHRADLYAVALIAYRHLTGQKALGFQLPTELTPGLASGWDAFARRGLSPSPDGRYASAEEMGQAVRQILDDIQAAPSLAPPEILDEKPAPAPVAEVAEPPAPEAPTKRTGGGFPKALRVAAAVAALAIVAFIAIAFVRTGLPALRDSAAKAEIQ